MSNDLNLNAINRALLRNRFAHWLDIIDKMREDRYTFLMPEEDTLSDAEKGSYKYQKLKDLLKYENGSLLTDRNSVFYRTLRKDFVIWNRSKDYPVNQVWTTPFMPDYTEENKTEQYPGVHGAKNGELPSLDIQPWSWACPATDRLFNLIAHNDSWGMILHEYCDVCKKYNGIITTGLAYCDTVGKVYTNHNGVTPTGNYEEFRNHCDDRFGNWQDLTCDSDGKNWRATRTWSIRIQINYTPPFDAKYRLILIGFTRNSFEFNGLNIADFADRWNVFFDSGPVQGTYTSPLIGTDQFYTSKNPEAFKDITNQHPSAGWKVDSIRLFILPETGAFQEHWKEESPSSSASSV